MPSCSATQPPGPTSPRARYSINGAEIYSRACYIHWDAAGKSLSLRDDGDTTWLGPVKIGASGSLSNSQCVLLPEKAHVTGSGTSATLSLPIEFTNFFAPGVLSPYNVYMQEQSASTGVGWQQAGTWIVPFPFTPVSVSPDAGSGDSQIFTFKMDGVFPEDEVDLSFSTSTAFGTIQFYDHGCAMIITPSLPGAYAISLRADLATSWITTDGTIGTGPALQNSQCSIDVAKSSAVLSGTTLTLQLPITFTGAFLGQKNVYVFGPGTGWPAGAPYTPLGTFTVTAPSDGRQAGSPHEPSHAHKP